MTTIVFYNSSMPPEVGAAALLSMLENVVCVGQTTQEANVLEKATVADNKNGPISVLFIGTYWQVGKISSAIKKCTNVAVYKDDGTISPVEFCITYARDEKISTDQFERDVYFKYAPMIGFLKMRHAQPNNTAATQKVLAGLNNHEKMVQCSTLFERMCMVLRGDVSFQDVLHIGEVASKVQEEVAKEQATKSSKKFKLLSGHTAIITNNSKLVNLTHLALHNHAPDADVSIVVALHFGEKTELSYSIRSYNPEVNAVELVRSLTQDKTRGDGNHAAAGGRVPINVELNI